MGWIELAQDMDRWRLLVKADFIKPKEFLD
jgi:hypothetical protein